MARSRKSACLSLAGSGNWFLYTHGYVDVYQPKGFYHLDFGVVNLPFLVQSQGFAFATTTYRQNGLAILEGADDMLNLLAAFTAGYGAPLRTIVAGASKAGWSPRSCSSGLRSCSRPASPRALRWAASVAR